MTQTQFVDRVAVVTGAAGGLGRASAELLAARGARVVVVDIDGAAAEEVAGSLPTDAIGVGADISDEAAVEEYMRQAIEAFGRVDMHHLNAGIFGRFAALPDVEVDDFDRVMDVNVRGQFLGIRAAFKHFRAQRSTGSIVVTASIASLSAAADLLAYHTSKHAVVGLVRGAAMYGGPLGIRVNAVAPGIVPTNLFATAASTSGGKNDMAQRASTTPPAACRSRGGDREHRCVSAGGGCRVCDGADPGRRWRRVDREHCAPIRRRGGLGHWAGRCRGLRLNGRNQK